MAANEILVVLSKERLQRLLAERGWSWSELRARAGIAHNTVSKIIEGEPVAPRTINKIVKALHEEVASPLAKELLAE